MGRNKFTSYTWSVLILFVLVYSVFFVTSKGASDSVVVLNTGWKVTFAGEVFEGINIGEIQFTRDTKVGDTVLLERKLPKILIENPTLRFKTSHLITDVYTDKLIYSYGHDRSKKGELIGSGVHYAHLSASDEKITIRLENVEEDAFEIPSTIEVVPAKYAYSDFNVKHIFALMLGVFLSVFGALAVIVSIIFAHMSGEKNVRFAMIGFMSIIWGGWTLCYSKTIQIVSVDFGFNTMLEYTSLYLAPVPLLLMLMYIRKGYIINKKKAVLKGLVAFNLLFVLVTTICNFAFDIHYIRFLTLFHIYVGLGFILLVFYVFPYRNKVEIPERILTYGSSIFAIIVVIDLIRYNLFKSAFLSPPFFEITWIPLGMLLFVLSLLCSYVFFVYKKITERTERDVLAALAYKDALTGLYNRAKCQQIVKAINRTNEDFAIVLVDMNGLKKINDNFGHARGDKQIVTFARVFMKAFDGVGTTLRVGGDEFLAIVRKEHIDDIESSVEKMLSLEIEHSIGLPIPLEVAFGIAVKSKDSEELGRELAYEELYNKADERMYNMKQNMKSNLVRK